MPPVLELFTAWYPHHTMPKFRRRLSGRPKVAQSAIPCVRFQVIRVVSRSALRTSFDLSSLRLQPQGAVSVAASAPDAHVGHDDTQETPTQAVLWTNHKTAGKSESRRCAAEMISNQQSNAIVRAGILVSNGKSSPFYRRLTPGGDWRSSPPSCRS